MAEEFSPAVNLLARQMEARVRIREAFRAKFDKLSDAHQFAFSALVQLVTRHEGKAIEAPTPSVEGRIALIAQFLIGVDVCETSISEGMYSQAAALLKQELETVAALEEYRIGTRKDGKTPQIGRGATKGYGRAYGQLNDVSHVGRHDMARHLVTVQVGKMVGANIVPTFLDGLAGSYYSQHVSYIILALKEADELFKEVYGAGLTQEEKGYVAIAQLAMLEGGFIEVAAETASSPVSLRASKDGEPGKMPDGWAALAHPGPSKK